MSSELFVTLEGNRRGFIPGRSDSARVKSVGTPGSQSTVVIEAGDTQVVLNVAVADTRLGEDTITISVDEPSGPVRIEQ